MSVALEKAHQYEEREIPKIPLDQKPAFHVAAPIGWINDPNGFSVYQNKIHLFYQYYPYGRDWGPMHWGHSVTEDMVRWTQLPAALAPDPAYDNVGCFSGSAITVGHQHVLIYTGVKSQEQADGHHAIRQNQCIAYGDGEKYEKAENNPVITGDMLPPECSRADFRDPKIWKEKDRYYVVIGNKIEGPKGQIVLFSSKDLKEWKFETILAKDDSGEIGKMWECPDFFKLGGKYILICSPQNMKAKAYEFHNGHNSIYFVGDYEDHSHSFQKEGRVAK